MKGKVFFLGVLLLLIASSMVFAQDYDLVVANSNDWEDVYNSLLYGSLSNTPVIFLSDASQSNTFFASIPDGVESVLVVESDERLSPTVSRILDSLGYDVEVLEDDNTGFFFASLLDPDQYILVDKDFPSNGISVASYAAATHSWVFFVDNSPNARVVEEVQGKDVITYGRVSQSILQATTPRIVIDEGNRYANSVQLAREFLKLNPVRQFVLAQGTFLESEFFIPDFPVMIVGISSTPAPIEDFFIESDVLSAVVVGQLSVPPSVNLKRILEDSHGKNIKLVAKLGQTSPEIGANEILPLNTFPIPSPSILIDIESAFYNQITSQLEVRFTNIGDVLTTFVPSINVELNGESIILEGDQDQYILEKSESRTLQFPVDISSSDEVVAQVTAIYGESMESFDLSTSKVFDPLDVLSIVDLSSIQLDSVTYDAKNRVFLVEVFNNGTVPTYVDASLIDIIIGGEAQTITASRALLVQPGESGILVMYAALGDADLISNAQVEYELVYGQRNFALIYSLEGFTNLQRFSLLTNVINNSGLLVGGVAILVIIILLFFILKKSRYECKHCSREYKKKPRSCESCGSRYFRKK